MFCGEESSYHVCNPPACWPVWWNRQIRPQQWFMNQRTEQQCLRKISNVYGKMLMECSLLKLCKHLSFSCIHVAVHSKSSFLYLLHSWLPNCWIDLKYKIFKSGTNDLLLFIPSCGQSIKMCCIDQIQSAFPHKVGLFPITLLTDGCISLDINLSRVKEFIKYPQISSLGSL